jgi:hypothetical protein
VPPPMFLTQVQGVGFFLLPQSMSYRQAGLSDVPLKVIACRHRRRDRITLSFPARSTGKQTLC